MQDLVIRPHVVNFRCERWQTPDGGTMTAPLPAGINGHFGPQLRRFVLAQYHQGQMTVPRLVTLLRSLGIFISKRQVVRLLIESQDNFLAEARDVLRAGLSSAAWITVDDTGARHKATNGFCTQMGNAHFTWFGTTACKSRLNFLELLRAGYDDYVINAEALAYMRQRALAAHVIARLLEHPDRCFAGRKAWTAHLERLGISALEVSKCASRTRTRTRVARTMPIRTGKPTRQERSARIEGSRYEVPRGPLRRKSLVSRPRGGGPSSGRPCSSRQCSRMGKSSTWLTSLVSSSGAQSDIRSRMAA